MERRSEKTAPSFLEAKNPAYLLSFRLRKDRLSAHASLHR
jgi:hypothetical protein